MSENMPYGFIATVVTCKCFYSLRSALADINDLLCFVLLSLHQIILHLTGSQARHRSCCSRKFLIFIALSQKFELELHLQVHSDAATHASNCCVVCLVAYLSNQLLVTINKIQTFPYRKKLKKRLPFFCLCNNTRLINEGYIAVSQPTSNETSATNLQFAAQSITATDRLARNGDKPAASFAWNFVASFR